MLGEWQPDPELWPFIAPTAKSDDLLTQSHLKSEAYVVELCSLKHITTRGHSLQLNYLTSAFPTLFSEPSLKRNFWALSKTQNQQAIDNWLIELVNSNQITREQQDFLRDIRIKEMNIADIRRDVRWIIDSLPYVVFQTHVDANLADGTVLLSRRSQIDAVVQAVRAEGGLVYEPSALMLQWGQQRAMKAGSTTHYSDEFADALFDDLWTKYLAKVNAFEKLL